MMKSARRGQPAFARTPLLRVPLVAIVAVALLLVAGKSRADGIFTRTTPLKPPFGGPDVTRSGLQEWGIQLGYGTSKQGQTEIMPVYASFGWSLPDAVDLPMRRHGIKFNWLVEPWIAGIHTPNENAVEFGVNPITFKIGYDVGQMVVPYIQGGIGVMATFLQDGLRLGGPFEFDETFGAGLDLFCAPDFALTVGYRYRHMSNASISSDNSGLDTQFVTFGINFQPAR